MVSFEYIIKDPLGIHARPAGMLVRAASSFQCDIYLCINDRKIDAKKLFAVLTSAIKTNTELKVCCDGSDERKACELMEKFFAENL